MKNISIYCAILAVFGVLAVLSCNKQNPAEQQNVVRPIQESTRTVDFVVPENIPAIVDSLVEQKMSAGNYKLLSHYIVFDRNVRFL